METVEILYYKWCISEKELWNDDYIYIKTVKPNELLVYCKVERWTMYKDVGGGLGGAAEAIRTRTVPVKREEMEKI